MLCSTQRKKLKMPQESQKSNGREIDYFHNAANKIKATPPSAYRHIHLIFLAASIKNTICRCMSTVILDCLYIR